MLPKVQKYTFCHEGSLKNNTDYITSLTKHNKEEHIRKQQWLYLMNTNELLATGFPVVYLYSTFGYSSLKQFSNTNTIIIG